MAHIHLEPNEASLLEKDLEKVFAWIKTIETVIIQSNNAEAENPSILRRDVVTDGKIPEKIIKNAPQTHGHYFSVPKVIES